MKKQKWTLGEKLKGYYALMLPWAHIIVFTFILSAAWIGKGAVYFDMKLLITLVLGVLWANIYNVVNHIYDLPADATHDYDRPLVKGVISIKETYMFWAASTVLAFIVAFFVNMTAVALTAACLLISIAYSVPPLKLKRWDTGAHGLMGLGYGVLFCLLGWSLHHPVAAVPLGNVLVFFLVTTVITMTKDYKDVEEDKTVGIITNAVKSLKFAYTIHTTWIFVPYVLVAALTMAGYYAAEVLYYISPTLILFLLGMYYVTRQKTPEGYTVGYLIMMLVGAATLILFSLAQT
jgi:chlorophyll synthase/bacteriochlorophyll c synthase